LNLLALARVVIADARSTEEYRPMRIRLALAAAPLLVLGLAGCGAGTDSSPAAKGQPPVAAEVKIVSSSFGQIIADQADRTLYAFVKDNGGTSACAADCLATWPALTSEKPATAGPGADATLLKTVTATEGTKQARYGEWPLYYYAGDVAAGDVNGQGVDGEWFVIKADGKLIKAVA
jgi:predicted lipoprotein with Yx(FWY)xxD motif